MRRRHRKKTDPVKIKKTQLKFKKTLYEALKKRRGTYTIGFQGGNIEIDTLRSNEKIWYIYDEIGQDSTPRYWNAFGVSEKLNLNSSNPIVVEINIPLQGINRRVAGLFAVDSANKNVVLLH